MLVIKNITNNATYIAQELHIFYDHPTELHLMKLHLKLHYKAFHCHQYFPYILQLIYQLIVF